MDTLKKSWRDFAASEWREGGGKAVLTLHGWTDHKPAWIVNPLWKQQAVDML